VPRTSGKHAFIIKGKILNILLIFNIISWLHLTFLTDSDSILSCMLSAEAVANEKNVDKFKYSSNEF